jgi:hypothetical protein
MRRHVDPLQHGQASQEAFSFAMAVLPEDLHDLADQFFRIPDDEEIEEFGKGFRVEGTWAAADHQRVGTVT